MVTKYRYTMKIDPAKMLNLIEEAIGRRPDEHGKSGLHTWSFVFHDTDITDTEKGLALAALPEWIKFMYNFSREVVVEEE